MMVSATCAVDQAPTDAITDTYDYDAFGNEVHSTGSTPNNFLYRGEQWDSDLGLYYLRARYYNTMTDRFVSRDPEDGIVTDPRTLHKYTYAGGDPIDRIDPTGRAEAVAKPSSPGALEYGLILGVISLQAAKVLPLVAEGINCCLSDIDSGNEYIQMALEVAEARMRSNGLLPSSLPAVSAAEGRFCHQDFPPPGDGGPSGESCGKCNCAIRCYTRDESGSGEGGYGAVSSRLWVLGRADTKEECKINAQKNFNSSVEPGQTAGHCNMSDAGALFGRYCKK